MGNYLDTKNKVKNHIYARVPLVIIHSSERERVERMLREIAKEMNIRIFYYTDVKQTVVFNSGSESSKDVNRDPLAFAQEQLRKNQGFGGNYGGITFVIGDARRVSEENAFSRELLDTLYLAMEKKGTIILVTPDYIWNRLAQFGLLTELSYPDVLEREKLIRQFAQKYRTTFKIQWEEEEIRKAAMMLRGFSEVQINNVLLSVMVTDKGLFRENLMRLTEQKSQLYAGVPCVDQVEISGQIEAAGLENLKKWIRERKKLFFIADNVLEDHGLTAPKGLLLAGIPGCGKSYAAKMIACEWELPLFRFDIGAIYDKWMGESERKMHDALAFIDHMAPCVVWIDEIEKALAISDSGNDTGKRILGQFLYWLQESKERVFLVATANDITSLPPELFRKGRFSEIFFIDLPDEEERRQTIQQYLNRCLRICPDAEHLQTLVAASDGFSYADIESAIKETAQFYLVHPEMKMTWGKIREFFAANIPYLQTNPESVAALRKWGSSRAVPASGKKIKKE